MNTVKKIDTSFKANESNDSKNHLSLVSNQHLDEKNEPEKMTKEYLNEKLAYFYNNGGPIMEL